MSGPFGSSQWMYASGGFYNGVATQSLRLNPADTLTKTYTTPTSSTIMSFGGWVKRQKTGKYSNLYSGSLGGAGVPQASMYFDTDDKFKVLSYTGSSYVFNYITTRVFRDVGSWYHIWVQIDTTDATQDDRVKIWINGIRETSFSTETKVGSGSPNVRGFNESGITQYFGHTISTYGGDVYHSDWYFIDGSAVSPVDTVGEFKNGVFIAKSYSPTFGNNGWHLEFNQTGTGTASSSTIGADTSGNANHFTSSGIVASDCDMPDSPENNFATALASLAEPQDYQNYYKGTYSEGNLKVTGSASGWSNGSSNFGMTSGKWYAECRINAKTGTGYIRFGVRSRPARTYDEYFWNDDGSGQVDAATTPYSSRVGTYTAGDILMVALDLDNSAIYFGKNGTWENSATSSEISSGTTTNAFVASTTIVPTGDDNSGHAYFFYCQPHSTGSNITWNFGQDSSFAGLETAQGNSDSGDGTTDFYYTPPTGFLANTTVNLTEPTISPNADNGTADDYFNTVLYTGTNATQSITGVGFQPDWVWLKSRSNAQNNRVFDVIRGTGEYLETDTSDAEGSSGTTLTSFDSDGFSLGGSSLVNTNTYTYVSWNWKAGGTAVSNTDGTITSSVSANTDAGFSIVSYTGTGSNATVGHGLSSAPDMIIAKNRDDSDATPIASWVVYSSELGAANRLDLNSTNASSASTAWNSTEPTSSVFSLGTANVNNGSGDSIIAYCFHSVEGFSKFGSYTGNATSTPADGTFVYTSFKPLWLMVKRTDLTGQWRIYDTKRSPINYMDELLSADASDAEAEGSTSRVDFLSNGFKWRGSASGTNKDGGTYIYMAFAETPFKYANAR